MTESLTAGNSPAIVRYGGREFYFVHDDPMDHVFSILKSTGSFYEIELLERFAELLSPGNIVADVGAYIGTHSIFAAGICQARVVAFEPDETTATILRRNIALNGLGASIRVEQIGLGAAPGRAGVLRQSEHNRGMTALVAQANGPVAIRKLDDFDFDGPVRLLKVDVEGMEREVLEGAARILKQDRPFLALEAGDRTHFRSLASFLRPYGYKLAGTYNWTPTHLFVHEWESKFLSLDGGLMEALTLLQFDWIELRDRTTSRLASFETTMIEQAGQIKAFAATNIQLGEIAKRSLEMDGKAATLEKVLAATVAERDLEKANAAHALEKNTSLEKALASLTDEISVQFEKQKRLEQERETLIQEFRDKERQGERRLAQECARVADLTTQLAARAHDSERLGLRRRELQSMLKRFAVGLDAIAHSRRWEAGNAIGRCIDKFLVRGKPPLVIDEMQNLVAQLRKAESSVIDGALNRAILNDPITLAKGLSLIRLEPAFIALLRSRRWRIGNYIGSLVGSIIRPVGPNPGDQVRDTLAEFAEWKKLVVNGRCDMPLLSRADVARLTQWFETLERCFGSMIRSRRWRVGNSVGRTYAALRFRKGETLITEYIAQAFHEVRALPKSNPTKSPQAEMPATRRISGTPPPQLHGAPRRILFSAPTEKRSESSTSHQPSSIWYIRNLENQAAKGWQKLTAGTLPEVLTPSLPNAPSLGKGSPAEAAESQASDVIVGEEDFAEDWSARGWARNETALDPGGVVRARGGAPDTGFVSRLFDFANGGLLEIEIETRSMVSSLEPRVLRIVTDGNEGVGPDFPLHDGVTRVRTFAPRRTGKIKFSVLGNNMKTGEAFAVGRVVLRRLDSELLQQKVHARIGEPVLASMASIPSRRAMLEDCVQSLLAQCDRVRVFLNGYADIPDFLNHPRVEVLRSQDWDDRGDAGKFFWLEKDATTPGYRLIVDDDLIFPPDFAETMAKKVAQKDKRAIYATHGVLLRQPVVNYYDESSRAVTFHFARELCSDRRVHVGATNALCLHSSAVSMRWADFMYCNSADIWLALYAQQNKLPIYTPARPRLWVRENAHNSPHETIYNHSRNRTRSRFDSSLVQDAVLKHNAPLTVQTDGLPKYGVLLLVRESAGLEAGITRILAAKDGDAEWIVMLAYDRSIAVLESAVTSLKIERETHLIDTADDPGGLRKANDLLEALKLDAVLCVESACVLAAQDPGTTIEVGIPEDWYGMTIARLTGKESSELLGVALCAGNVVPEEVERLASDLSAGPRGGAPNSFRAALRFPLQNRSAEALRETSINTVFERVLVLNLDRRPDRWQSVAASLNCVGIEADRFSAIDGSRPDIAAEYERYLLQHLVTVSSEVPSIRYARDLYMGYASQMARIAHLENKGRKAIASRGAWGYLRSYEAILEQALADGVDSLLVLDDDVLFHKDTRQLFAQAMAQLPDDWLILQLGTLQYNWSSPWADWHSPLLYRTNGSAVGSHAVGMRFDILPFLLDHTKRMDMPYDIGALSAATRAFPDKCFVIYPNLAIQSLNDSDICSSDFQRTKTREEAAAQYKWVLDDYR